MSGFLSNSCMLLVIGDQPHNHHVICELDDDVCRVNSLAVVGEVFKRLNSFYSCKDIRSTKQSL